MKLYTEFQINQLIEELKKSLLPENVECDGAYCMGCWKDVVRETIKMSSSLNPIELPSNEEIQKEADCFYGLESYNTTFINGAKWVIDKIKNQQ